MSFAIKSNKFVEMSAHSLKHQAEKDIKALEANQPTNSDPDAPPTPLARPALPGSQTGMYMRTNNSSYADYL